MPAKLQAPAHGHLHCMLALLMPSTLPLLPAAHRMLLESITNYAPLFASSREDFFPMDFCNMGRGYCVVDKIAGPAAGRDDR